MIILNKGYATKNDLNEIMNELKNKMDANFHDLSANFHDLSAKLSLLLIKQGNAHRVKHCNFLFRNALLLPYFVVVKV